MKLAINYSPWHGLASRVVSEKSPAILAQRNSARIMPAKIRLEIGVLLAIV